jgi:hypothetical protein
MNARCSSGSRWYRRRVRGPRAAGSVGKRESEPLPRASNALAQQHPGRRLAAPPVGTPGGSRATCNAGLRRIRAGGTILRCTRSCLLKRPTVVRAAGRRRRGRGAARRARPRRASAARGVAAARAGRCRRRDGESTATVLARTCGEFRSGERESCAPARLVAVAAVHRARPGERSYVDHVSGGRQRIQSVERALALLRAVANLVAARPRLEQRTVRTRE